MGVPPDAFFEHPRTAMERGAMHPLPRDETPNGLKAAQNRPIR